MVIEHREFRGTQKITESLLKTSERFGAGEDFTDAEIDDLRERLTPENWIAVNRMRERARRNLGKQQGPLPEGTRVALKGDPYSPLMIVEDIRTSELGLVQVVWFDSNRRLRRDALHVNALQVLPPPPEIEPPLCDRCGKHWAPGHSCHAEPGIKQEGQST